MQFALGHFVHDLSFLDQCDCLSVNLDLMVLAACKNKKQKIEQNLLNCMSFNFELNFLWHCRTCVHCLILLKINFIISNLSFLYMMPAERNVKNENNKKHIFYTMCKVYLCCSFKLCIFPFKRSAEKEQIKIAQKEATVFFSSIVKH